MAAKKKSAIEIERMTDANIAKVIGLLNPEDAKDKPITKKDACIILGMSYNTKRLDNIIASYIERIAYTAERKKALRGKPASESEVIMAIQSYIEGDSIDAIAKSLFRGVAFVKGILVKHGVTLRPPSHDYFHPELIPDEAVRDKFNIGEIVYSARYNSNAEVRKELVDINGLVYRIWLLGDEQKFAYTPVYELASLEHLRVLGVKV